MALKMALAMTRARTALWPTSSRMLSRIKCPLLLSSHLLSRKGCSVMPHSSTMSTQTPPVGSKLVYKGTNQNYIFYGHGAASLAMVIGIPHSIHVFNNKWLYMLNNWHNFETWSDIDDIVLFAVFRVLLIVPIYLGSLTLTFRTLNKVHYSDEEQMFYGEYYTWYLRKKYILFAPGDGKEILASGNPFSFLEGSVLINSKPYILIPENFKSPMHYNLLLGSIKDKDKDS